MLRNPLDNKESPTQGSSLASLFGQAVKARRIRRPFGAGRRAVRKPAPEVTTIEVYNGGKRTEQRIDNPEK